MITAVNWTVKQLERPPVRNWAAVALWVAAGLAVAARVWITFGNPLMPGEMSGSGGYFGDFRDTIWTPGRFMLDGGNPYDPVSYLGENPWALPFSLYNPAWLVLAAILAPLPYLVSVAAFQALSLGVAIVMLRILCKWAVPTLADIAVPAGLLWMNIWYPGRGAISVQLGSLLAVLGVVLVLRSLTRPTTQSPPAQPRRAFEPAVAVGVAFSLIKVQFGALAIVALAGRRAREVVCGILGLILASIPILITLTLAAGGPLEFVRSVQRDLAVLTSEVSPTGLSNPGQERFDLLGILARHGLIDPPLWLQVGIPLLGLLAVLVVIRLTRDPLAVSSVFCSSLLIGFYHGRYDLLLLYIPVVIGVGLVVRRQLRGTAKWITLGALTLVVLHLHTVSRTLIPGLGLLGQDTIDMLLIAVGLAGGLCSAVSARRRNSTESQPILHREGARTRGATAD